MDFAPVLQPPLHIPLAFGCVRAKKKPQQECEEQEERQVEQCVLCGVFVKVSSTLLSSFEKPAQDVAGIIVSIHWVSLLSFFFFFFW